MATGPKNHGDKDKDDIRVALKLPARGSLQNRQVSSAFKKIKQALRSSSGGPGGRTGVSTRQRGSVAAGSAMARNGSAGKTGAAAVAKPKPLQRVSVRWTYSKNQGDGQWGAHGKYIERESAQDKELDQERSERLVEQVTGPEHQVPSINPQDRESEHERASESLSRDIARRYANPAALRDARSLSALRQSYAAEVGKAAAAKSINDLRSLSGVGMVQQLGRGEVLLQSDASRKLVQRRSEGLDGVRRGSASEPGKDRTNAGRGVKRGALGFGSDGPAVAIAETLNAWQKAGDERMFKLIISPEFGERMDLRKHVSKLMQQMEKDLGTPLQWVAIDHYNTDHPHVHVAVRGIDDRGRALEVSPAYIAKGSRIRSQELATAELGYRSERDVTEALERQITQQRFTDIDRGLLKAANEQGVPNVDFGILKAAAANERRELDFSDKVPGSEKLRAMRLAQVERLTFLEQHGLSKRVGPMKWWVSPELATKRPEESKIIRFEGKPPASEKAREMRLQQIRRLAQLTEMGLAEKIDSLSWRLKPTMESALRQMQVSQDRLKTKFAHRELISDPQAPLVATELKELGQRVSGKVVGTGLNEATGKPYIMIEGLDGKVHYLTQAPKVQKLRGEGELKAGEYVAIEVVARKDRSGNQVGTMQKVERHGRTLTPALLDEEILKGGKAIEPAALKNTVATGFRDAAAARIARLEAAGALEVKDGAVSMKSALAHDRIRYQDAGMKAAEFEDKGALLVTVLAKGKESIVIAAPGGRAQIMTADQLQQLGLQQKYVAQDANIFIGIDRNGQSIGAVIRPDQVETMVKDMRANRLDSMLQQLQPNQVPSTHPLSAAIRERAEVWQQRGVEPMGKDFVLRANVWRKGAELQAAAEQQGVEKVLEELSREKGKPVRQLDCEPGRQVSGRVLLVKKEQGHTSVVIDTGRELTNLRVPEPEDVAIKAGQRMRARAEQINEDNAKRRMMTWRFADLEREEARQKGREGKAF